MKNELKLPFYLAFQSMRRGRKWTQLLTIILMAAAFINLTFVSALFNGIVSGSNKQIIDTLTSNVYMLPKQGVRQIDSVTALKSEIRQVDRVQAVTSSRQIPARLERNAKTGQWPVIAIKPDEYAQVFTINQKIYEGKYLDSNDPDGILLGRQIAGGKDLEQDATSLKGAMVGDAVNVVLDGTSHRFIVRGIFYTKFVQSDSRAFITEKGAEKMGFTLNDTATTVNVKSEKKYEADILRRVQGMRSDIDSFLWTEATGLMKSVSSSFVSINTLLTTVGVVIAAVTTFIVIYVDIVNRRRQIGILRAVGIKPYIIVISYVILAVIYASLGVLLGTLIFYVGLVPYSKAYPFHLPITDAVLDLQATEYIFRLEIMIWVAAISGLIPALVVTRGKMLDAIRGR